MISCLGLLGISLFDIRRRYREIAIRKVNGAKPKDLYILLGKNYMLNLVLAFVLQRLYHGLSFIIIRHLS